ncbi:MAG TPA: aminotransferase class I/II-fold pyridoxal phosphate-dependent enzyme [Candidatus Acidoferrales bacterium]|nr:aminotransferase class I/II-fold pyridoxal phosphate-dependent enzyme [Candidatus Acidoferrales bacterium]
MNTQLINLTNYYVPNKRIAQTELSLIRSIIETQHTGEYSRVSLGLGELQFPMPKKARAANQKAINEGKTNYTPNAGLVELRDAIADRFSQQFDIQTTRDNVIITSGSTGGLYIAFETMLNPGDEVLIPALQYPLYKTLPEKWGAHVIEYALMEDFDIDVDDLLSKITARTKLIVINSPSNPTGQVVSLSALMKIVKRTIDHLSLFFLSDEIYATCLFEGATHHSISSLSERTIVVNGLSKQASQAGKRIGWIIGPDFFITDALKSQQATYVCAPIDSQYAALPVLKRECDKELALYHKHLDKRRKLMGSLLQEISGLHFHVSHGAFYYFVDVSAFGDGMTVAKKLIETVNVVTIPGIAFGRAGKNFIRLSYAASEEEIREGLQRMKGVFASWR